MNHIEVRAYLEAQGLPALPEAGQHTPPVKEDYVFQKEQVQEVAAFLVMGDAAMKLTGPQGCGKTALITQVHAAMNWPLLQPAVHAGTELSDLLGQITPTEDGSFRYMYGLLVQAAISGASVFIDEYNVLKPSVTTALNPILERGKIDIPETGETIVPHPGFRIFVAENPNDKSLGFHGRNEADAANRERFYTVKLGYLSAEVETAVLMAWLGSAMEEAVASEFAKSMIELARRIRTQYMGTSNEANALEASMSTRTLVKWAKGILVMGDRDNCDGVLCALERVYLNAIPETSACAVRQIYSDIFKTAPAASA